MIVGRPFEKNGVLQDDCVVLHVDKKKYCTCVCKIKNQINNISLICRQEMTLSHCAAATTCVPTVLIF